jgi:hypothetical protein
MKVQVVSTLFIIQKGVTMKRKNQIGIIVCMALTFFSAEIWASSVPDTGQTKCYDDVGNVITCTSPGQAFYGQDANYLINPNAFVKMDAAGKDLASNITTWAMVRDTATGLVWESKNKADGTKDYTNPHDTDNTYTWYDPDPTTNGGNAGVEGDGTDTFDLITALNQIGFGGYTDWRIPSREELRSIVDYSRFGPAINKTYFPLTVSNVYWTANTSTYFGKAWGVNFYDGSDGGYGGNVYTGNKYCDYYVRAVRGGQ